MHKQDILAWCWLEYCWKWKRNWHVGWLHPIWGVSKRREENINSSYFEDLILNQWGILKTGWFWQISGLLRIKWDFPKFNRKIFWRKSSPADKD
jgi:hypothetical protein